MTIGQESYVLPPWDEPEGKSRWSDRIKDGLKRARAGYLQADLGQRDLPFGDETVVRLLTSRYGDRYQHFFNDPTDPEGGLTSANCCASAEFQGPRDDVCPICAYAKDRGGREEGGADMNHTYYLLLIRGKLTTVIYRDSKNPSDPGTPKREIVWDNTPLIFECTNGIYNSVFKYHNNVDFPPEAKGDITRYAFKIDKKKGATSQQTKYDANPLVELLPNIEIPVEKLKEKWEYIRKMCQPTEKAFAAKKLGLEIQQKSQPPAKPGAAIGGDFDLEPPVAQPTQSRTAGEAPDDEEIF